MGKEPPIHFWNAVLWPVSIISALQRPPIVPAIARAPHLALNNFGSQCDSPGNMPIALIRINELWLVDAESAIAAILAGGNAAPRYCAH
ncbi:MAG: hypothetical protein QF609_08295 [Gammaproteobacteria bacterium]|jgi:hypothetical protein|nr:hypothetical protein [Gammaproteobacteria bacterium]